ncbi:arsenate reductase (Arc2) [Penicillium atrosanguineum]|uniref:Arsenate reductase (Arc2) n=1 Tax=Penicillium atrosanguineum TaxID=1132637 RepID=A0A9W9U6R5_9EURO|nr:arsenate reductase (Arc2) [Penicillium atrosanguineum]
MAAPDVPRTPWHTAYPAPTSEVDALPRQELLRWIKEGKMPGKDYVLVDVRRNDFEGGTIRGSVNLPAQSLYPTRPALYTLFASSGVKHVIWYCGKTWMISLDQSRPVRV